MFRQYHHFLPQPATIETVREESDDTRTFVLRPRPPVSAFDRGEPGQFVMLSILGHGEAAFSLSALPGEGAEAGTVVITVRRVGDLTGALFALNPGARVGLRGPFGRGFPSPTPEVPTLYVAGGCGLSPLKAAIERHVAVPSIAPRGTRLAILYGARMPAARIHRAALERWRTLPGCGVVEIVQHGEIGWDGRIGVVGDCIAEAAATIGARRAAVCGPPAMLWDSTRRLVAAGLPPTAIHVAMERYMKCGTGHCGHCYVNHRYVCRDGPVFSLAELLQLPDVAAEMRYFGAA